MSYKFIFIVGCSGSGTSMLLRIMSTPGDVLTLGGNHRPLKDPLISEFNDLTKLMWDRLGDIKQHKGAKKQIIPTIDKLMQKYNRKKFLLYKRSAPFGKGDRYTPDLNDIVELFDDLKIIVMTRDPIMSTMSSFRRNFGTNLRNTAIMCDEQLTRLNSQVSLLDPSLYRIVRYEKYCSKPKSSVTKIAEFTGLTQGCLLTGNVREDVKLNTGNKLNLTQEQSNWLAQFFSDRKESWPLLMRSIR